MDRLPPLTVTIAGPAASGKSTVLTVIEQALRAAGLTDDQLTIQANPAAQHEDVETPYAARVRRMTRVWPALAPALQVHLRVVATRRTDGP